MTKEVWPSLNLIYQVKQLIEADAWILLAAQNKAVFLIQEYSFHIFFEALKYSLGLFFAFYHLLNETFFHELVVLHFKIEANLSLLGCVF